MDKSTEEGLDERTEERTNQQKTKQNKKCRSVDAAFLGGVEELDGRVGFWGGCVDAW